jgi:hypothetical protein
VFKLPGVVTLQCCTCLVLLIGHVLCNLFCNRITPSCQQLQRESEFTRQPVVSLPVSVKDFICVVFVVYTTTHCSFKAYCAILVRRSKFRHQASPSVSPRESTQRRKVELWTRKVPYFCLNAKFHVTFRALLHAVKLLHGTDGFTSPPKEDVLRIFSP